MSYSCLPSNEFATLCQSQMALLSQSLGAVWSAVYLRDELSENRSAKLLPFAIYPRQGDSSLPELPGIELPDNWQQLTSFLATSSIPLLPRKLLTTDTANSSQLEREKDGERKRLILPLIYQDNVMGLLVTGRNDRDWQPEELSQIKEIVSTLAIARFLELQYHWSQEQLAVQTNLRRIEYDRIDDLLHQLRNPLTALKTFSKLLLKRLLPEDPQQAIAKNILVQTDRFADLLQQFEAEIKNQKLSDSHLTLSTTSVQLLAEAPAAKQNFLLPEARHKLNSVNLNNILEPLSATYQAIAAEKDITYNCYLPQALPNITADFKALREVLNNLIDNALKYTPSGGKVEIKIQISKNNLLGIVIQDTGYGISLEDRERIFERRYRGKQAQSDIPGSGLGLAIAKELIEQMQGKIELISPNNLEANSHLPGTTFIVWLPLASN